MGEGKSMRSWKRRRNRVDGGGREGSERGEGKVYKENKNEKEQYRSNRNGKMSSITNSKKLIMEKEDYHYYALVKRLLSAITN